MADPQFGSAVVAVARGASRLLRLVREKVEVEPEYETREPEYETREVADFIGRLIDGEYADQLSAKVTAYVAGDEVAVMLYPHDDLFARTSPVGQLFTVTVAPGPRVEHGESPILEEEF